MGDVCSGSRTTLPLFLQLYPDLNDILIIVPESVYVPPKCGGGTSNTSIGEVYQRVKDMYEGFLREIGVKRPRRVKIIVSPSIGVFRNYYDGCEALFTSNGDMVNYYYYILWHITDTISRRISRERGYENIEIHLDLSHGVNYMPALAYRAVSEISNILAWKYNVVLNVYNSEPVLYPSLKSRHLVHVVEKRKTKHVHPLTVFGNSIRGLKLAHAFKDNRNVGRELSDKTRRIVGALEVHRLKLFIASIANALPLLLYNSVPPRRLLRDIIQRLLELYLEYTSVTLSSKSSLSEVIVDHMASFHDDFGLLVQTYLYSLIVGIPRAKTEVSLEDINKVVSKGIYAVDKKAKSMISRDTHEIRKRVEKYKGGLKKFTPLYRIFGMNRQECENQLQQRDRFKRNFLAHSGLESCIVEVKRDSNKILLRYRKDYREHILDAATSGLITP